MKVAVVGSRNYPTPQQVRTLVRDLVADSLEHDYPLEIVSGGANGVDTWAVQEASAAGAHFVTIPANWQEFGKSAGYIRNTQLVDYVDRVVAFWDGESKGTKHTIDYALSKHKSVAIWFPTWTEVVRGG